MNSLDTISTFLGWCMVLNFAVILLAVLIWSLFHEGMANLHAKIFGITREEAKVTFFRIVQQYRLAIAFLNVVPYIALQIMM